MLTDSSDTFKNVEIVEARRKYNRMLRLGVPIGAVRQAIERDLHFFKPPLERNCSKYETYNKMLKNGLPVDAVCHKMWSDGYGREGVRVENMQWWWYEMYA